MNQKYKFGPVDDMLYVENNTNICMTRWIVLITAIMLVGDIEIRPSLVILAVFLSIVSIIQEWFNYTGCRLLITQKMNYRHGRHYRKYLNQIK